MIANQEVEYELDNTEVLLGELQQDAELTRLTEMVRKHYLNYLEKQLLENLNNCGSSNKKNGVNKEEYDEILKESIKKTAELLEDKAVKSCMIAQFYQRAMVKIISIVRRSTQEKKIISQLEKLIQTHEVISKKQLSTKETQTEAGLPTTIEDDIQKTYLAPLDIAYLINKTPPPPPPPLNELNETNKNVMSLDEKIQMFQKHLQKEKCEEVRKKCSFNRSDDNDDKLSKKTQMHKSRHRHHRPYKEHHRRSRKEKDLSPAPSIITPTASPQTANHNISVPLVQQPLKTDLKEVVTINNENNDDSVALELARLFSEEKTELDEIFGIDPNEEPDDPQICKILKEIEEAIINNEFEDKPLEVEHSKAPQEVLENPLESLNNSLETKIQQPRQPNCVAISTKPVDLSKSIWPCELFMQRRKLSESLTRLIEEDLRWHDVLKWKFYELFGEDSDDEFTPCSPSIELDDILLGSCIRRISPWIVKHLMKPMKHGLIGNRFLFKKLAKHLARCIIMENQYPDESLIKNCIENFFCLHQVVMSLDDLVDMPSISLF